ncbi:TRAP transporter small permease [Pontibacillus sp. ALD_SL1]|uniref:TRAP transporter small permease n=1 Tax=Pontibacillus sp. ALD_SL1 TaxID=2777185 RepID=UPI001A9723FA|nr:TRAP transporter small permease [Pontibacillus sp. ALD_SL1]QST01000.1 TRAP transporter small permease [Pontibacillus sp. ALD_SL1]
MQALKVWLHRLEEVTVAVAMSIAVLLSFVEVVLRKFFGESLGFTHELVVYLLIYAGLIGAAIGVREKVHLGVDLLVKQFSPAVQKAIVIGTTVVSIAFTVIITMLGIEHVLNMQAFGQVTPELEIPLYIPLLMVPLSFALMALHFINEMVQIIRTDKEKIFQTEGGTTE